MTSWYIAVVIAVFVGVIGYWATGIAEDAIWMAGDRALPECDKLIGSWQDLCREQNRDYYSGKALIQFFGFIIPLIVALLVFLRHL